MSLEEFLVTYGLPHEARRVGDDEVEYSTERLPETLLDFWRQNGVGSYASGSYWLCTPALFDPLLDVVLENVPDLKGNLAAFGYRGTGQVDLWHRDNQWFVLLLPFAWVIDETSRNQTAPVPYDLADLYQAAGVPMPDNAAEQFLAGRNEPENIWSVLFGAASTDSYKNDIGDDGEELPSSLKMLHGDLEPGEFYCRDPEQLENVARSYKKMPVRDVIRLLPNVVTIERMIEADGIQQSITTIFPIGNEG